MDADRFDLLTRTLSSRRTVLAGHFAGAVAVLLGLPGSEDAVAHTLGAGCRQIQNRKRRRVCLHRARAHNRRDRLTACAGCRPWETCTVNGSCADQCSENFDCRDGHPIPCGGCSQTNTEGFAACIARLSECPTQTCASTADCPRGSQCQPCDSPGPTVCVPLCA